MSDAPIVPNVTPVAPVVSKAPVVETKTAPSIPVPGKQTPGDAKTADKVKTDTPAEKEVIRKIKVGDTDYDETTLTQMIEKAKGAEKKFLEASQAKKEAIRFFKMAKENPREFLEKTGLDPKKFAYDEVAKDIQDKLRDPKEVELEKAQQRLKEYEAKEQAEKERVAADKLDKETKALEAKFHSEMIEALEAFPQLPKNGYTVAALARAIETVRDKHGVLLTAKQVAPMVVQDIRSQVMGVIKGASAEQLESLIGSEGMEAIRKYDVAKLKNPLGNGSGATGTGEKKPTKKWTDSKDFWKSIDKAAKAERGE